MRRRKTLAELCGSEWVVLHAVRDRLAAGGDATSPEFFATFAAEGLRPATARRIAGRLVAYGLVAIPDRRARPARVRLHEPEDVEPTPAELAEIAAAVLEARHAREIAENSAILTDEDEIPDIIDLVTAVKLPPAQTCRYILKLWRDHMDTRGGVA